MTANIHTKFSLKHTLKESVRYLTSKQLVFSEFGKPSKVLKLQECKLPDLGPKDVLVRMLAAPVNPADINTIQGICNRLNIPYNNNNY